MQKTKDAFKEAPFQAAIKDTIKAQFLLSGLSILNLHPCSFNGCLINVLSSLNEEIDRLKGKRTSNIYSKSANVLNDVLKTSIFKIWKIHLLLSFLIEF